MKEGHKNRKLWKIINNAFENNYNNIYPRPPLVQNSYVPNTTYATGNNIVRNDLESTIRSFIATQK
jgi:hypothetical protein